MLVVTICAGYAYYVDSKRSDDDPKKRDFHPLAILLAPITFPLVLILSISFFVLRVLTYGVFMVLFILALIIIRKPFILAILQKIATAVGDRLMEANTIVIRFFLGPWVEEAK
jgi:hypothetical protein